MNPRPRLLVVLLSSLVAAACTIPNETADFATNELLYVDVPFATKSPGDREVFVAPVADARESTVLPTQERGFPISYGSDDFWERPIGEMMADVLQRQLEDSQLFAKVVDRPSPQALLIKPTLVAFTTGATEAISGSRSFAEVGLKLQVLGPADAQGARPMLMEQTFGNRQLSSLEVNPVSPYRLVGRALQLSMQKALTGLDSSNVGRSNVPSVDDLGVPATPAK